MSRSTAEMSRSTRVCAALIGCAGLSAPTLASVQPEKDAKAGKPVFVMDFAGMPSLLVDAKDRKLKEAMEMLPARLRELPREIDGMDQVPAPVVETLLTLLTQPARLAVTFNEERQDEGMFGMGAVLSFGPGEQQKMNQMHGTINALLAMGGMAGEGEPSARFDQMVEIPSPMGGVVRYGPRKAGDAWRYEVHAGIADDPDAVFSTIPAAGKGVTPVMRGALDFRPIGPMIEQNLEMIAGPEGEELAGVLEQMGLIGDSAVRYVWTMGYTETGQVSTTIVEGMKAHAKTMGVPAEPLTPAHFAMIPADATVASIMRVDMSSSLEAIEELMTAEPEAEEAIGQFTAATGVDPIDDLLACLGGTFGFYMSESTGGQLGSMIAFASLKDRPRFEAAHEKLVGFANMLLASEDAAQGYMRVRAWDDGDTKLFSLAFPGMPVPAEVTWALQGDWVVVGMMPQSTLAATRQIAGKGDKGLGSSAAFTSLLPKTAVGSFSYVDTPRVMKDGYQYVALLGSALANAARSPSDPNREPGLVVPTFRELKDGARPMVSYSYWRGDDYVTESHADRSMLVNACGIVGAASPTFPLIGMAIGAAAASGEEFDPEMIEEMFDNVLFAW